MQDDKIIKLGSRHNKNIGDKEETLFCSFCGKSRKEVMKMVKGPGVNICSDCVMIAVQYLILNDKMPASESQKILDTFWEKEEGPA